jgi:solute:Na+ symporter, SSS family
MEVHTHFTALDWGVLIGYLLLTTWVGHRLRGQQANIKDFFLAGRSLPWPAVCGSIVATEISAVTFIGVPGAVFALTGNFTYLQWAIGSIIARCIVGLYFVRVFYERDIYSPYDYMAHRLGPGVKGLTTALFMIGSVLGQSVRVLVPAMVLRTVTPLSMTESIVVIAVFAVVWTLMGGMTTVIWTDVMQFFLFIGSGLLALFWMVWMLPEGWTQLFSVGAAAGKFEIFRWLPPAGTDAGFLEWVRDAEFTMWTALLAMPFQNLAAFGTDQLNAQRMFCCRSSRDASKAIIFSSFGQIVTILMLMVGAALFVFYQQFPPNEVEAALFKQRTDYVFPVWITTVLPPGITGLVLAGAFAAAISSLDSALGALSQTSISLIYGGKTEAPENTRAMVHRSRIAVVIWSGLLALMTVALYYVQERAQINLLSLAFGMVSYTYGTMLGIFVLALFRIPARLWSLWVALVVCVLLTAWVRPDVYVMLGVPAETMAQIRPTMTYPWLFPINFLITFSLGWMFSRRRSAPETAAAV